MSISITHLAQQIVASVLTSFRSSRTSKPLRLADRVGPGNVLTKLTDNIIDSSDVSCLPTASQPDVDCCMNRVLAKSFVYGVDVQWDRLFESRLYRPFVPVWRSNLHQKSLRERFCRIGDVEQIVLNRQFSGHRRFRIDQNQHKFPSN